MGVYKEIAKADGSGITTFYRLSEENSTVETTSTGTTKTMFDYNDVLNKPSINDVALIGNKTLEDLGIQPAGDYLTEIPAEYITEDELEAKDYATEAFVIEQINNTEHFHREIVDALPLTGKDNILYLVPKKGSDKDIYNEYIWTGVDYELMGTTAVDLSDYYKKGEVDALLDNKVSKVSGKQLSTNDYTTAEKTKLASLENYDDSELRSKVDVLHNYDDTEVKQEINQLKTTEEDIYKILDNTEKLIDKKVEGMRLVKSGDSWTFYDMKGSIISFQLAKTSLGLPNTILFLEDIENDGKMTPVHYDIDEDTIHVYYTNYEGEYRYAKLQSSSVDDSILGTANHYIGVVDTLPTSANKGDIAKLSTDKTIYLCDGTEWSAFDKASEVDLSNYLAKDNTIAYKPATDYNPSTKKYVDDSIADIFVPTKTSQLTNDSGFVLKSVNDLTNYYNKSNTYNKSEVNALVAGGGGISVQVNNTKTESTIDAYSCNYINNNLPFIARYGETSYADIVAAHEAGKTVIALRDEYQYQLYSVGSSRCVFGTIYELTSKFLIVTSDNTWSYDTETLQKNLVFNTAYDKVTNKVATMKDTLDTYSTEEQVIGEWLEKPLYRKVINLGSLPNATSKEVSHNISNLNAVINAYGVAIRTDKTSIPLPYTGQNYVEIYSNATKVAIYTTTDRSAFTGYVTLEYTKTTD